MDLFRESRGLPERRLTPVFSLLAAFLLTAGCEKGDPGQLEAEPAERVRPSIVLILADDIGIEAVSAYGSEIETPALDDLASAGVRFDNAHATPLCTPSRVRLLTGQYSFRNYKAFGHLDAGESTIAKELSAAGYVTGVAGKWQLSGGYLDKVPGSTPAEAGFDESFVWHGPGEEEGCRYWSPTLQLNGRRADYPADYGPDLVNRYARDFVRRHAGSPFFLYYSMILPHDPFVPTPDSGTPGDDAANFRAMMATLDALVGDLREEIESQGIAKNTLVLFLSDNGTHPTIEIVRDGALVRGGKGTTLDAGTHVPFIAAWPAELPAGSVFDGMVDLVDIHATIRAAARINGGMPSGDGYELLSTIAQGDAWPRTAVFMDFALNYWNLEPTVYAFDQRWKLYNDGRMFDLAADPEEASPILTPTADSEPALARLHLEGVLDRVDFAPVTVEDRYFPADFDPDGFDFAGIAAERRAQQKACAQAGRVDP